MPRSFSSSRRRITGLRLSALGIDRPRAADPVEAVRSLLAAQAQDFPGALWAIGLRTPGTTIETVRAAIEDGRIVRAWPMRGTLHLVAAEDLGWITALTRDRAIRGAAGRHRQLELDEPDFALADRVARIALANGPLDRTELLSAIQHAGLATTGQRGPHVLQRLALTGVIVFAGQNSFALVEQWIPNPRQLERDAALAELAIRYFHGHGPATERDLSWWSSLSLREVREGIALAGDALEVATIDEVRYFHRPGLEPAASGVHLLPGFDEYILGYTDRSAPLAGHDLAVVVPGGNGMFISTVVVNGEVTGIWRRTSSAKGVKVALELFRPLSATTLSVVDRRLQRYARFVGSPVTRVEVSP